MIACAASMWVNGRGRISRTTYYGHLPGHWSVLSQPTFQSFLSHQLVYKTSKRNIFFQSIYILRQLFHRLLFIDQYIRFQICNYLVSFSEGNRKLHIGNKRCNTMVALDITFLLYKRSPHINKSLTFDFLIPICIFLISLMWIHTYFFHFIFS